jgi:hypothetical protein
VTDASLTLSLLTITFPKLALALARFSLAFFTASSATSCTFDAVADPALHPITRVRSTYRHD